MAPKKDDKKPSGGKPSIVDNSFPVWTDADAAPEKDGGGAYVPWVAGLLGGMVVRVTARWGWLEGMLGG